ncbi:MAG: hypothetical protein U1A78_21360 [Polyangia bacterium]
MQNALGLSLLRIGLGLVLLLAAVAAEARPERGPDELRPDLRALTVRRYEPRGPREALTEVASERLTYDATGHLTEHVHRGPGGKLVVRTAYTWDRAGHLIETHYSDASGRVEIRKMTYRLDAAGRVLERELRNPAAPAGEVLRDVTTWSPDGSRTVQSFRHYATEGPYPEGSAAYDAAGRLLRSCTGGHCSLYEYDEHGEISRIRQQSRETHHYLVYESRFDAAGRLVRQRIGGTERTFRLNPRGDVVEELEDTGGRRARLVYTYEYR